MIQHEKRVYRPLPSNLTFNFYKYMLKIFNINMKEIIFQEEVLTITRFKVFFIDYCLLDFWKKNLKILRRSLITQAVLALLHLKFLL